MTLRMLLGLLLLPLLYVLAAPSVALPAYNLFLFPPNQSCIYEGKNLAQVRVQFNATVTEVTFPNLDGSKIHGWYFRLPNATKVFLYSHGRGIKLSNRLNTVRALLLTGGSVLDYDCQGTGASGGAASIVAACDTTVAAYDYLVQEEHVPATQIVSCGQSFGCGPASQLVKRRHVSAVILQGCYSSLLKAGRDWMPWLRLYPDNWFPRQVLDTASVFASVHPPLLLIEGENDRVLSTEHAKEIFYRATEPKKLVILEGAGHNISTFNLERTCAVIGEFLKEQRI